VNRVANEVAVTGLRPRFGFLDLQGVLGLDRRCTTKAINLLVRTGYLLAGHTRPTRYSLTKTLADAIKTRSGPPMTSVEAVEAVGTLIHAVRLANGLPEDSRISEVAIMGMVLDVSVEQHPFIETAVTVNVIAGRMAGIQMRRIEKMVRYLDKSLHVSLVLNST
jgi:hypothetical protein